MRLKIIGTRVDATEIVCPFLCIYSDVQSVLIFSLETNIELTKHIFASFCTYFFSLGFGSKRINIALIGHCNLLS